MIEGCFRRIFILKGILNKFEMNTQNLINPSMIKPDFLDLENMFYYISIFKMLNLAIPFPNVEITGLTNGSTVNSNNSINVFINGTLVPYDYLNESADFHSLTFDAYYSNPAFSTDYMIQCPINYSIINVLEEMISVEIISYSSVNIVPNEDPNINDKYFSEARKIK